MSKQPIEKNLVNFELMSETLIALRNSEYYYTLIGIISVMQLKIWAS